MTKLRFQRPLRFHLLLHAQQKCPATLVAAKQRSRPADPVCSSFLIAGWQAYLHTGNQEILKEAYPAFRAWNDFLSRAYPDGIVAYSHYGDWAGPAYACESMEGARSSVTPGELMSTGYRKNGGRPRRRG